MAATGLTIKRTTERPSVELWLSDRAGALIDFSSGYTFEFKLGARGQTATFTKTSTITGAAGAGAAPSGTPNVTIAFSAGELDALTAGGIRWQLKATTGSLDRIFDGACTVEDIIL